MLKEVRRALLVAFAFSGAANVLMLATPLYTLQVFEAVVPLGSLETLLVLTVITAAAILALGLIEIARDVILQRAGVWLEHELGPHLLRNGLRQGTPCGELRRESRALEQVKSFITSSALHPLFDAPWTPIFLCALLLLHPHIGAVAIVAVVLLGLAAVLQSVITQRLQLEGAAAHERAGQWTAALSGSGPLMGALGLAAGAAAQWERLNRAQAAASYSQGKRASFVRSFARTARLGSQIALYGIGAWLVVRGELTPGALVASAILLARALAPIEGLVSALRSGTAAWRAYRCLHALPDDAVLPHIGAGEGAPRGALQLANVTVFHPGRKSPALRAVSLALEPGQALGIVGPTGSGKSTLAAVIAGALAPTVGAADLDGIPIAKWQRGAPAPPIGYVPDEPSLLQGTVHENIARFAEASLASVVRAATQAGVDDVLQTLPVGYDTEVGPGGAGLALGERRAVAMARALHGAPRLVVLDEPEMGRDGAGVRRLISTLEAIKADGVGIVIATQDPRLLALTDRIVVMNGGALHAEGAPGEFSARAGSQPAANGARAGLH
jgi:ATP-binding cassette subfamily C exporter for protease/lipase